METYSREQDEVASLGIVFFSNNFIRALDEFRETQHRPERLAGLCDDAISSLRSLRGQDIGQSAVRGMFSTPDDIAVLARSTQRYFQSQTTEDAARKIDALTRAISHIKTQKGFTEELGKKVDEVLSFFGCIAEEGLANCRRQAAGDLTEAQRIWQHYAMS